MLTDRFKNELTSERFQKAIFEWVIRLNLARDLEPLIFLDQSNGENYRISGSNLLFNFCLGLGYAYRDVFFYCYNSDIVPREFLVTQYYDITDQRLMLLARFIGVHCHVD